MAEVEGVSAGAAGWFLPSGMLAVPGEARGRRTARDWAVDTLAFCGAVLVGLVVSDLSQKYDRPPAGVVAADLLLGGLACVSLWWRRRYPLGVALAAIPALTLGGGAVGAGAAIVATLAMYVRRRPAIAVLSVYIACSVAYVLFVPRAGGWLGAGYVVAYYLVFFAWGASVRSRRLMVVMLRDGAERERIEHARQLADSRRLERQAIAREMHDVLAHRISLVSVHAGALAYRARQARSGAGPVLDGGEIATSAGVIVDNAHRALEELRDVLQLLRAGPEGNLEDVVTVRSRIADLDGLLREARDAGQVIDVRDGIDAADAAALQPRAQRAVVRMVQEGLTNVRKHAPGAPATVRLSGRPGAGLSVEMENPSATRPGGAAIPGGGRGLVGLRERVELAGGTMKYGTEGGQFRLRVWLPWPGEKAGR